MQRVSVQVSDGLYDGLRLRAARERTSMSALAGTLLAMGLEAVQEKQSAASLVDGPAPEPRNDIQSEGAVVTPAGAGVSEMLARRFDHD